MSRRFPVVLLVLAVVSGLAGCGSPCRNYCERKLKQQLIDNFGVPPDEACQAEAIDGALTCAACEEAIEEVYDVRPADPMCAVNGAFLD